MKKGKRAILIIALILSMCVTFPIGVYAGGDKDNNGQINWNNTAKYLPKCYADRNYKKITVKKNVVRENGAPGSLGNVTFGIYKSYDDAQNNKTPIEKIVTNRGGIAETNTYLYHVKAELFLRELSAPAGYEVNKSIFTLKAADCNGNRILEGNNITRDAVLNTPTTSIKATKIWDDLEGFKGTHQTIHFQLYQGNNPYGEAKTLTNGVTEVQFDNLPLYNVYGNTPVKYQYSVREVENLDGYVKTENNMTVTNTAIKPVKTNIIAYKDMRKLNQVPNDNKKFEFQLKEVGTTASPVTAFNDEKGNIVFKDITFDYSDVGIHEFQLSEVRKPDGTNGIIYDKNTYKVFVKVTQNSNTKQLSIESVCYKNSSDKLISKVIFTNTYKAKSTSFKAEAKKVLENAKLKDGDFTFELYEDMKNCERLLQRKTNDIEGTINFDEISYTKAGTYNYTIKELPKSAYNLGMDFDTNIIKLKVVVAEDIKQGKLYVKSHEYTDNATFINVYTAPVDFTVTKTWENDTVKDRPNSISVQLYQNGKAYGNLVELTEKEDWTYTWENLDGKFEYTADEVKVPDNYVKKLKATENGVEIVNSFNKKAVPVKTTKTVTKQGVKTGDSTQLWLYMTILFVAGSGACGFRYKRKHNK